jgi:hypothetical protein
LAPRSKGSTRKQKQEERHERQRVLDAAQLAQRRLGDDALVPHTVDGDACTYGIHDVGCCEEWLREGAAAENLVALMHWVIQRVFVVLQREKAPTTNKQSPAAGHDAIAADEAFLANLVKLVRDHEDGLTYEATQGEGVALNRQNCRLFSLYEVLKAILDERGARHRLSALEVEQVVVAFRTCCGVVLAPPQRKIVEDFIPAEVPHLDAINIIEKVLSESASKLEKLIRLCKRLQVDPAQPRSDLDIRLRGYLAFDRDEGLVWLLNSFKFKQFLEPKLIDAAIAAIAAYTAAFLARSAAASLELAPREELKAAPPGDTKD